jgi:hypothetical protein
MKKKIIIFSILLVYFGCSSKDNLPKYSYPQLIDTIKFPLDSLTPDYFHGLEFVRLNNKDYLTFLNDFTNSIYYYNFENQELENILSFEISETGIRKGIMSYFHIGSDSIFLFGEGLYSYMVSKNGKIIDQYNLLDLSYQQSTYSTSKSPAIFWKNSIYYNSLVWGYYDPVYKPLLKYDIPSQTVTPIDPLPSIYFQAGDWGSFSYDYVYQVLDPFNKRIIYSFPASNSLFSRDLVSGVLSEIKESSFFDPIKPPFESNNYEYDSEEWNRAMNNTPSFSSILVDIENSILIRAYLLPKNSPLNRPERQIQLLKYDLASLNLLEVITLPDNDYDFSNSFFKKSDLYIRKMTNEEDFIVFDRFQL